MSIRTSCEPLVIGVLVATKGEKDRLSLCQFAKSVGVRFGVPFCLCSLGSGVCPYNGKRAKFKFHFNGFEVIWICEKLIGLPDLER